jgi:hypothetical protein
LFRIGLAKHLEARVEGNTFTVADADNGVRHAGLAATSVGLKCAVQKAQTAVPFSA